MTTAQSDKLKPENRSQRLFVEASLPWSISTCTATPHPPYNVLGLGGGSVWPSPTPLAQAGWVPLKYYIKQVRKVGRGSLFEHTLRQLRLAQRFRRGEVFKSQIRAYLTSLLNKVTTVTWARLIFDLFCKSVHTLRWFCVVADHRGGEAHNLQKVTF
jgi:hypothetical protein